MEGIVGLISFGLCAVPFLILAHYGKGSKTPVSFWAGDDSLSDKVKNLTEYNAKMAKLYGKCAAAFAVNGICCLISVPAAMVLLAVECTAGFYIVYKKYKNILDSCSDSSEER